MKVILQKNVQSLGKAGDVVEAAAGYFRNYLQPRGIAVLATEGAMRKREEDLEQMRKKAEGLHQAAVELAEKITAIGTLRVFTKAGEGGRLYGKITNKEIAQEITKTLGTEIDKRTVKTLDDISALGSYKVQVKLAPEVQAEITVDVHPEGTEEEVAKSAKAKAAKAEKAAKGETDTEAEAEVEQETVTA
jgi:large subunit ribosomal protein L9